MELFQEFVFAISFSFIVSLLIVKLISVASSFDDGNSKGSKDFIRIEEKIEENWVVFDSEKEGKVGGFDDQVEFGCFGGELGSGVVVKDSKSESEVGACKVFDESPERTEFKDSDANLVESDEGNVVESAGSLLQEDCVMRSVEEPQVLVSSAIDDGEVKVDEEDEVLDDDDDDWQGIEATELEKCFGAAVAFMDSKVNSGWANSIDNDVKVELYGLHRVAIEGSCFEPQPMAIKVSARANWNSWKRLENLGREDAMERYVALLSQHVPDWMGSHSSDKQ